MDFDSLLNEIEAEKLEGRAISRRFTVQLTGANTLEKSTKAALEDKSDDEDLEEHRRWRLLYETPEEESTS
jgi:hypothetical protein